MTSTYGLLKRAALSVCLLQIVSFLLLGLLYTSLSATKYDFVLTGLTILLAGTGVFFAAVARVQEAFFFERLPVLLLSVLSTWLLYTAFLGAALAVMQRMHVWRTSRSSSSR